MWLPNLTLAFSGKENASTRPLHPALTGAPFVVGVLAGSWSTRTSDARASGVVPRRSRAREIGWVEIPPRRRLRLRPGLRLLGMTGMALA